MASSDTTSPDISNSTLKAKQHSSRLIVSVTLPSCLHAKQIDFPFHMTKKVVLVTGGSGLVGKGIEAYLKASPRPDETWVYLGSKDGDLTYVH